MNQSLKTGKRGYISKLYDNKGYQPFVNGKKHWKTYLEYLIKKTHEANDLNELRHLYFDTNLTQKPSPHLFAHDIDLYKEAASEYLQDILHNTENLLDKIQEIYGHDKRVKFEEDMFAFKPIISFGEKTTHELLEANGGDLTDLGRQISDFAKHQYFPEMFDLNPEDIFYFNASQKDNGNAILHNHSTMLRFTTDYKLIDFNPDTIVMKNNKTRVKLSLRNLDVFDLQENDFDRASKMWYHNELLEFEDNEDVKDYLHGKIEFKHKKTFTNDSQTIEIKKKLFGNKQESEFLNDLKSIIENHKHDTKELADKLTEAEIKFALKKKKKDREIFLNNKYVQNFPVSIIQNKELVQLIRNTVEFKLLNEQIQSPDTNAYLRLAEAETIVSKSTAKTITELNQELQLSGLKLVPNISKAGKISGFAYVDTVNNINIKASLSEQFNLSYFQNHFDLKAEADDLKFGASKALQRKNNNNLSFKHKNGFQRYFDENPVQMKRVSNWKPFRLSAYDSEEEFLKNAKYCSLAQTKILNDIIYNRFSKPLFEINRSQNEIKLIRTKKKGVDISQMKAAFEYMIAAGAIEFTATGGTAEELKEAYKLAAQYGLTMKGYEPDYALKQFVDNQTALKNSEAQTKFNKSLDTYLAKKAFAELEGKEFTEKLYVNGNAKLQVEIDTLAAQVNYLQAISKGVSPALLMNFSQKRALAELEELTVIATELHEGNELVEAHITRLQRLSAASQTTKAPTVKVADTKPETVEIAPEVIEQPKPRNRPKLDL